MKRNSTFKIPYSKFFALFLLAVLVLGNKKSTYSADSLEWGLCKPVWLLRKLSFFRYQNYYSNSDRQECPKNIETSHNFGNILHNYYLRTVKKPNDQKINDNDNPEVIMSGFAEWLITGSTRMEAKKTWAISLLISDNTSSRSLVSCIHGENNTFDNFVKQYAL